MKKILSLVLVGAIGFVITGCDTVDDVKYAYPDSKEVVVDLETYNKLENGMTEAEVWDITGGKCTLSSESGTKGEQYYVAIYGCNGKGKTGANVLLTFSGDKLNSKTQAGLK